ncbi:unnamed protein product [Plutella xylostella]|uniref:(diamondback moth) hypothetical protein n=1 Tax=Plutella xylostella TaxID=51655 RepID=A0A8S4FKX3_PLUXY|nr:unnamed protein product [Plutella xylostella]
MNNTQCCSHCDTVLLWIPKAVRIELKCEQVEMDVEIGKDDISSEDGRLVVFGDLCSDVPYGFKGRFPWRRKTSYEDQVILNAACGALRPGRLTFILGPSGAGKTTLMTILAGRKKTGVSGCLLGVGREAVLVSQQATLLDVLTGRETLQFAAALKLPDLSRRDRLYAVENVSRQLGIQDALNTKAGDMSGGERKRLNIACELLTDPMVMLLDEPTSGLDSVSSMSVIRALHSVARGGRTVACVVHQPASKLYSSADDVILLANGRTLYAGAVEDAPATFQRAGFHCPQYYNMADFILEVASGEHAGNLALLENEARSYAHEMRKIAHNEVSGNNRKLLVPVPEAEALLQSPKAGAGADYPAGVWLQLRALLWRCSVGSLRDVYLSQARLACHLLVALLLGALYAGAGEDGARVTTNTSCLFFFLLFLFFSNAMPTIQTFPAEASVVVQEHLNRWYSLTAYCISKIVSDLPLQVKKLSYPLLSLCYLPTKLEQEHTVRCGAAPHRFRRVSGHTSGASPQRWTPVVVGCRLRPSGRRFRAFEVSLLARASAPGPSSTWVRGAACSVRRRLVGVQRLSEPPHRLVADDRSSRGNVWSGGSTQGAPLVGWCQQKELPSIGSAIVWPVVGRGEVVEVFVRPVVGAVVHSTRHTDHKLLQRLDLEVADIISDVPPGPDDGPQVGHQCPSL